MDTLQTWEQIREPGPCSRQELVDLIFELAEEREYDHQTTIIAVMVADRFILNSNRRSYPLRTYKEPAAQIYSVELGYASLLLASKWYEDEARMTTREAIIGCDNYYLIKLEWELFYLVPVPHTCLELLYRLTERKLEEESVYRLASIPELGRLDPRAVLIGVLLSQRK